MSRLMSSVILAVLAAGCGKDDSPSDVTFRISNQGVEPAVIAITTKDSSGNEWDNGGIVRPGETWVRDFGEVDQVNVIVTRLSDNAVLLSDSWKAGDLARNGYTVDITVNP